MSVKNATKSTSYFRHWKPVAVPLALGIVFVLLTGLLDGNPGVSPAQWYDRPLHLFANALPGLLLAGLLVSLTRRIGLSFGLAYLAQALIYAVNAIKVKNLGTPLVPADFRMVGQLKGGGAHLLGSYLPHSPWPYLAILGAIALIVIVARLEKPWLARRTGGRRLLVGLTLTALIGTLLGGVQTWSHLYSRDRLGMMPWSAAGTATYNGTMTMLMQFHLQASTSRQKADPQLASEFIAANDSALRAHIAQVSASSEQTPDIVIVQSESFFDPSIINGYEHANLTPNLHRLQAQASSGGLHVPTFGGGTIRTEFEMLTGLSLRYFPDMQFPYLQMNTKVVPSMVRTLRSHGYETVAVHGNDASFWNRTTAFKALGFDRFVSQPQFPKSARTDGAYMADSAMTDEIMTQLKDAGPPQLVFAISMEAHGPYDNSANIDTAARDAIPVPAGIEGNAKRDLQTYVYHMQHADQELGRLAELLSRRDRPTLLLFYGDHLPALIDTYAKAGFRNGESMATQQVPWIMLDTRNPQAGTRDMAAWTLPGMLLDRAGIHDDAYFALTQVLAPQLARLTRAPDAPQLAESGDQKVDDNGLGDVAQLRMKGKLEKLMAQYAVVSADAYARQHGVADDRAAAGAGQ